MWREGASSVFGNNFFPFSRCFHLTGKAELHLHSTVSTTLAYINESPGSVWVLAELALTHRYTFFKSQRSRDSCLCSHIVGAGNRQRGTRGMHAASLSYLGCDSFGKLLCYPLQDCSLEHFPLFWVVLVAFIFQPNGKTT